MKGKILESIIPDVFYLVENIHKNSHKKYFDLPNERDIYENLMDWYGKSKELKPLPTQQIKRNKLLTCLLDNYPKSTPIFPRSALTP